MENEPDSRVMASKIKTNMSVLHLAKNVHNKYICDSFLWLIWFYIVPDSVTFQYSNEPIKGNCNFIINKRSGW